MFSIFLKKIAPPAQSPPAGIGVMSGILIKDHDFLKNHLKTGKTKTGQRKKGAGSDFFKNRRARSGTGTGKRRGDF
jgi:hypothetical protein